MIMFPLKVDLVSRLFKRKKNKMELWSMNVIKSPRKILASDETKIILLDKIY